jgi:hypothetical protein
MRTELAQLAVELDIATAIGEDRIHIRTRADIFPPVEQFHVVAAAVVKDTQAANFETWWSAIADTAGAEDSIAASPEKSRLGGILLTAPVDQGPCLGPIRVAYLPVDRTSPTTLIMMIIMARNCACNTKMTAMSALPLTMPRNLRGRRRVRPCAGTHRGPAGPVLRR